MYERITLRDTIQNLHLRNGSTSHNKVTVQNLHLKDRSTSHDKVTVQNLEVNRISLGVVTSYRKLNS